jgi:hypothetical protein
MHVVHHAVAYWGWGIGGIEDGTYRFSQMSVRNYHYSLRNNLGECSSQFHMHMCNTFSTPRLTSVGLKYLRHLDLIPLHQK